jgi:hypothetical protein
MAGPAAARPGPSRTIGAAAVSPRWRTIGVHAVALATAVAVVALLVGLSVAPRLQPGDWFQVKPRAVKQQIQEVGAPLVPGHGSVPLPGAATPVAGGMLWAALLPGWSPELSVPVGTVEAPSRSNSAGRAATAAGCRGPPA